MIAYIVEFFGTLLFLSVIIMTGKPVFIALALLAVILLGGSVSGGHFNPAVSVMFWAKGTLTNMDLIGYIISQVLGGLGALYAYKRLM